MTGATFDDAYLRGYCPCATCQGHRVAKIEYRPPSAVARVSAIEPVGNYAISIAFTDGHATGIYRFEFLREICPCEACATNVEYRMDLPANATSEILEHTKPLAPPCSRRRARPAQNTPTSFGARKACSGPREPLYCACHEARPQRPSAPNT